jgi:hypothetical protein
MEGVGVNSNFLARDPCRETFQLFLGKNLFLRIRKRSLPENSKPNAQQQCSCQQAAHQEYFLWKKFPLGKVSGDPWRQLLCKESVLREKTAM